MASKARPIILRKKNGYLHYVMPIEVSLPKSNILFPANFKTSLMIHVKVAEEIWPDIGSLMIPKLFQVSLSHFLCFTDIHFQGITKVLH